MYKKTRRNSRIFRRTEYIDIETGETSERIRGEYFFKEERAEIREYETEYNKTIITTKYGKLHRRPTQTKLF
ncbi:hypothetical protein [Tortoise microvirus 18]|nr:hypothetical protein [Tortoise microvirus 18]